MPSALVFVDTEPPTVIAKREVGIKMQNRNNSMDLLRVVSMFMILSVHFLGWGGAVNKLTMSDINYYIAMPIYFISQIGNTLFFLLTGYFSTGNIRARKLVFLQRKTSFYAFGISLVVFLFGLNPDITIEYVFKSLFPIVFNRYWFISVYFILYVLSAPLYKGLTQCSSRTILLVVGALLINNTFFYPANMTLLQGVLAFVIGYYLRAYRPFEKRKNQYVLLAYIVFLGMYAVERVVTRLVGIEHTKLDEGLRYILILLMAVMFFVFFEKIPFKAQWPSKISANVISVYLISACPPVVAIIYTNLVPIEAFATKFWFVPYYIVVNILIFALCIAIDKVVTMLNNIDVELWFGLFKKLQYSKTADGSPS